MADVKGVCTRCGGDFVFDSTQAGNEINCPHCDGITKLIVQRELTAACTYCGGTFNFPEAHQGTVNNCPHCSQLITLAPATPNQSQSSASAPNKQSPAAAPNKRSPAAAPNKRSPAAAATQQKNKPSPKGSVIAHIGQSYSTSVFVLGDGLTKTSVTLTSERITGRGKSITAEAKGSVVFTGDLKSISSVSLIYNSRYIFLVLAVLSGIALIGSLFMEPMGALGCGLFGGFFIALWYATRERYIVINFQGFAHSLSLRGITNEEVERFMEKTLDAVETAKR